MDKFFPLKLYIFKFETSNQDLKSYFEVFKQRNVDLIKSERLIDISIEDNEIYLSDKVVLEKTAIQKYLNLLNHSLEELKNFQIKGGNQLAENIIETLTSSVMLKIIQFAQNKKIDNIDDILPELYLVNKFKVNTEIESGILFCEKCNRWFPIIETIPQMLPDEFRDKEKDIEFLKTKKNLLEEEFLSKDLKPFNI